MIEALLGIPGKVKTLLDRLTDTRAANLENINLTRMGKIDTINTNVNTTVSSRAAQTTADNIYARTDVASSTRASQTSVDTLTNRLSDQRALNLDNLLGVSLSELPGGKILTNDIGSYPNLFQAPGTPTISTTTLPNMETVLNFIPGHLIAGDNLNTLNTMLNINGPGAIRFLWYYSKYGSGIASSQFQLYIDNIKVVDKTHANSSTSTWYFQPIVGNISNAGYYSTQTAMQILYGGWHEGYLPFRTNLRILMLDNALTISGCKISFYRWA